MSNNRDYLLDLGQLYSNSRTANFTMLPVLFLQWKMPRYNKVLAIKKIIPLPQRVKGVFQKISLFPVRWVDIKV